MTEVDVDVSIRLRERMVKRLDKLFFPIAMLLGPDTDYWVAGNSCNAGTPNDFDLYCKEGFDFAKIVRSLKPYGHVLCTTRNALTVSINGKVVQFCNYKKGSLLELIRSFDFAHIQVGVQVHNAWDDCSYISSTVTEAAWTLDYSKSKMLQTTWYTGSEYPLSSLMRCVKYAQRGDFLGKSYKVALLTILSDIISQGYDNYEDFKDQMAAVDLLLLEESESNAAWELYNVCGKQGIVRSYSDRDIYQNEGVESDDN